jgi:protein phosphatase
MRIAIISDIHGNFVALKTALLDIKGRKVNRIVCLGDVAATGSSYFEKVRKSASISLSDL